VADSLHDELLAIPGIDEALLEGDVGAPHGVRVRLSAGADPLEVGQEVQRVLASHGMRSQMAESAVATVAPPPARVVNLADYESDNGGAADEQPIRPVAGLEVMPPEDLPEITTPSVEAAQGQEPPSDEADEIEDQEEVEEPAEPTAAGLASVSVTEDADGIVVTVSSQDGRTASRRAQGGATGVDRATATATSELVSRGAGRLVGVDEWNAEGSAVMTVLVEDAEGRRRAGATTVEGSRAYAVARAVWVAFSGQDALQRDRGDDPPG
jgi:hypothetical protein